ncbi:aminoglycoside phosphotransferase family protein [Deinococcus planocerae]|uniref:aminoglycoside phosphotransferase family protein n=1 Tax=Deinococcus planocerae TaxID=1737569 RepID=UPI001FEB7409|nr:aminoglycoside phosphotransferase family protein [Deinococcus planocerae]
MTKPPNTGKMHEGEVETSAALVRSLLTAQFPHWADLPLSRVQSAGTDNAIYRLGDDLAVRLPRIHWATGQIDKEFRWLPRLAPLLPLTLPVPMAKGEPGEGYPWPWGVYTWLPGENATPARLADPNQAAVDLAGFILALQRIDPAGGPLPEPLGRGVPLATRDAFTREHIARLPGDLDAGTITAAWEHALRAPAWDRPPVWIHGDLQAGNLLAAHGRLRAVIDFGALQVGDPACELAVAWRMLDAEAREVFRAALSCDEATWARARGWALSVAVVEVAYYLHTNPVMVAAARHTLAEALSDHERGA